MAKQMPNDSPLFEQELYVPREIVFDLWTDAAHLEFWYPPPGATNKQFSLDAIESGIFDFSWHSQDAVAGGERGTIAALAKPSRLVFRGELVKGDEATEPYELEVILEDHGGKTGITINMANGSPAARDYCARTWPVRFDELEQYLSSI